MFIKILDLQRYKKALAPLFHQRIFQSHRPPVVLFSGLWSGCTQHQFFLVVVINGIRGEEQRGDTEENRTELREE
jgi:hypothetical protein